MSTFDDEPGWADENSFRELFETHSRRVYGYARRQVSADVAESVVQDVFTSAWRHAETLPDDPLPWLLVTARNSLLTHWRSRSRQARLAERVAAMQQIAAHPGVDQAVVDRAEMLEALASLSHDDREALLLVGWDGLDHSTAADVMGCSPAAFTARIHRARARLQRRLEPTSTPITLTRSSS